MRKFIETRSVDSHGGTGWEYGKCLWSPVANKKGARIYELMHEPQTDDLIIHFYKDGSKRFIHGQSFVERPCYNPREKPTDSQWSWADEFYRIDLKNFIKFENPIPLDEFVNTFDIEIRHEYEEDPPNYPFQVNYFKDPKFKKDSSVGLRQGKYLTEATNQLFNLIKEIEEIQNKDKGTKNENSSSNKQDYLETKRKIKESTFFARNPNLKRDAIKERGYKCEACGFKFEDTYGEFGADYIECHHENPLSERPERDWSDELKTSINDVKLLCSNCHRMIHRTRPAKDFEFLLSLIKNDQ